MKYDICIIVTTFQREKLLKNLLEDIKTETKNYNILTVIFNDGSTEPYNIMDYDVKYIKYIKNHGKYNYWNLINKTFKYIKNIEADYYIYMPDDVRLKPNIFSKSIEILNKIKAKNKVLNILSDKQRLGVSQWTNFKAKELKNTIQQQWCDMCFITTRNIFELLEWQILPINQNRWLKDKNKSSGVGKQISERLHQSKVQMHHIKESLIIHDNHESMMNKAERELNPLTT